MYGKTKRDEKFIQDITAYFCAFSEKREQLFSQEEEGTVMSMDLSEKRSVYTRLSLLQKRELKKLLEYFNSAMWFAEPHRELFGVDWFHSDLIDLCYTEKQ